MMPRQLESVDTPLPNTEEETKAREDENAWTILDSIGAITN